MAAKKKPTIDRGEPREPLRFETGAETAVLHLEGVVGIAQAKRLHALALELVATGRSVAVRGEHLQRIDAAAIQVLLGLSETLRANGKAMSVQHLPDSVQRTLRHAGLASAF